MIDITDTRLKRYYQSVDGKKFEVTDVSQQSEWVSYRSIETGIDYTCRREAFEQRFREIYVLT